MQLFPINVAELKLRWQKLGDLPKNIQNSTVITCNMKTLVNGWATTSRYQETNKLRCMFGCGCAGALNVEPVNAGAMDRNPYIAPRDSLKHYLECDPFGQWLPVWSMPMSVCVTQTLYSDLDWSLHHI